MNLPKKQHTDEEIAEQASLMLSSMLGRRVKVYANKEGIEYEQLADGTIGVTPIWGEPSWEREQHESNDEIYGADVLHECDNCGYGVWIPIYYKDQEAKRIRDCEQCKERITFTPNLKESR